MARPSWYTGPYLIYWNNADGEPPDILEGDADNDYDVKIDGGVLYLRHKVDTNITAFAPNQWSYLRLYATDETVDLFPNG